LNQYSEPEPLQNFQRLPLNMPSNSLSNRQIGVSQPKAAKNLVEVETRTKTQAAGATTQSEAHIKGKIIE
jgi:hypothetical protein